MTPPAGNSLPDLLAPGLDVVFCGINPGMSAAAAGHHFMGRSNRFWKTIHLAGFTPTLIDPFDDRKILEHRCGLTTVVERPTARADELLREEYLLASAKLSEKIEKLKPKCLAFLGKPAYQAISGKPKITWGKQPEPFGGAMVWVLPNPSGLNRGFSLDNLVQAYQELRYDISANQLS
ncbi:G:T/U mismatch-specific DNA glycosylase [Herbaspirillum sp. CF444]|uniref:G/U mismatch-specific DNA glycosylase n=1 Tax=Herbaspirillum sp. CF444 TaxID=1144319 RepID=UPI00027262E7|nr:G/U mismatch-specific DNA glycosylase [Herbaspirillum sp. CF444]EJL92789.1 G:T/U mismatch-specific DNA glycosylase [Herbaspirillum sp. CF444]